MFSSISPLVSSSGRVARTGFATVALLAILLSASGCNRPQAASKLSAAGLRVTAISLGNPRMAIINGQQFTEGDTVTVRNPLPTKMNVVRIADGEVDLSDGSQTVTARLETMPTPPPKRKA